MAKRFIGIDIDGNVIRVAIAAEEKGGPVLELAEQRSFGDEQEMLGALLEIIGGTPGFSDRLAAALPARDGFVRWLSFPFADPRKLESSLGFELSAQLPVAIDDCTTDFRQPVADDQGGFRVTAAAVRSEKIGRRLQAFDEAGIPLHILDLFPFALAAGLGRQIEEGLLVCPREREVTVTLVRDGGVADFRLQPIPATPGVEELARCILREAAALESVAGAEGLPLYLAGSEARPELLAELRKHYPVVEIPALPLQGRPLSAEFVPAAALALRAAIPDKDREFNFRRGPFALKSEWAILKKRLVAAAVLLFLSATAIAGSAWLGYAHQAHRAEALKDEMVRIYRQTFPGSKAVVDVPLLMGSKIRELKKKGRLIGTGIQGSPLAVLREVSEKTPKDLKVDVRDFSYSSDGVKLEGETISFDAINRLAKSLESSPLFKEVQIADAKMSLDGKQVDFRLNLTFSGEVK